MDIHAKEPLFENSLSIDKQFALDVYKRTQSKSLKIFIYTFCPFMMLISAIGAFAGSEIRYNFVFFICFYFCLLFYPTLRCRYHAMQLLKPSNAASSESGMNTTTRFYDDDTGVKSPI